MVEKVLVSLPERFESKISSLEESRDLSKITVAELINALQATEQRRSIRQEEAAVESALLAKQKGKAQMVQTVKKQIGGGRGKVKYQESPRKEGEKKKIGPCFHCGKDGHTAKFCWFRPNVQCRWCKQLGHVEKVCKNKGARVQQAHQAHLPEDEVQQNEEKLFVATCFAASSSSDSWLVDSGCTNHMTHNEKMFKHLDRTFVSKVKIGNGDFVAVHGKGEVAVDTPSGIKLISDVLYVPEISENLLSVGQMLDKNYSLNFSNKTCTIYDPQGCQILQVAMRDKSFVVDLETNMHEAFSAKVDIESKLWHKRLGHFNYSSLKSMHTQQLTQDMPVVNVVEDVCEACQFGKQQRLPFPSDSTWRATEKLQLIHTDVCGPMSEMSLNGSKYFLIFIDDFSRMCWVYFLKQNSEVANVFTEFKALVENQSQNTIKMIRSDNGTEYTAHSFQNQCKEAGVLH